MTLPLACVLFLIGIGLIVKGGSLFVDAAVWMARASGLPPFFIGATIVSVATTLPELLVSVFAAAGGSVDLAAGNAVGSVGANTGLILAVSILLLPPQVPRRELLAKGLLFFASCAVLLALCLDGTLTLVEGIILLALFGWFLAENLLGTRKTGTDDRERIPVSRRDVVKQLLLFGLGATALVLGSDLLVDSGTFLAQALGISQRLIAITMVAIGTSLPELVTTITALVKRHGSLSIGNILGANIIDLTLILPLCALVSGGALPVSSGTANIDLPICLAVATLAVFPALLRRRFTRWQGFCMLALYLGYLTLSVLYGAG